MNVIEEVPEEDGGSQSDSDPKSPRIVKNPKSIELDDCAYYSDRTGFGSVKKMNQHL